MGRTTKYPDSKLLDAVIQYSDICLTVIKCADLARWAGNNIEGLEGVQGYHFVRTVTNPVTGKKEKKECTKRLEEINATRNIRAQERKNCIISTTSIDSFYALSERAQRREIQEVRDIVTNYRRQIGLLQHQHDIDKNVIETITQKLEEYSKTIQATKNDLKALTTAFHALKKRCDLKTLEEISNEMGISNGDFDISTFMNSTTLNASDLLNIDAEIRRFQAIINASSSPFDTADTPEDWKKKLADELTNFSD